MSTTNTTYSRILFPIDIDGSAEPALPFVASLARHTDATVLVLHNLESPTTDADDATVMSSDPGRILEATHETARERTEAVADRLTELGVSAEPVVTRGVRTAYAIREQAEAHGIDLITLQAPPSESLTDRLLGSTPSDLLSDSPCDLLVFTSEQTGLEAPFRRVLVPVNYRPESVLSLRRALRWVNGNAQVELFYDVPVTFPFLHTARGIDGDHSVDAEKVDQVWNEELERFWLEHGSSEVEPIYRRGDGGWLDDSRAAAEKDRCDLIVATEHRGLGRGLAERLAAKPSICPVLLVRAESDDELIQPPFPVHRHAPSHRAEEVLGFWFGELDDDGLADEAHSRSWWQHDPSFDAEIQRRFGGLHAAATKGRLDGWSEPRQRLAELIVLDQFSRNLDRGTPAMFANDEAARTVARELIEHGHARDFAVAERTFCYVPFMHSEELSDQEYCVALFRTLVEETHGRAREAVENNLDFARRHHEIIERFGRFPHRNDILGRDSTPEEQEFLKQPGSSF